MHLSCERYERNSERCGQRTLLSSRFSNALWGTAAEDVAPPEAEFSAPLVELFHRRAIDVTTLVERVFACGAGRVAYVCRY